MNRIDKLVVFQALGRGELERILTLELNQIQERILRSAKGHAFAFSLTGDARDFLIREGTDLKYGARHLKRALEKAWCIPCPI